MRGSHSCDAQILYASARFLSRAHLPTSPFAHPFNPSIRPSLHMRPPKQGPQTGPPNRAAPPPAQTGSPKQDPRTHQSAARTKGKSGQGEAQPHRISANAGNDGASGKVHRSPFLLLATATQPPLRPANLFGLLPSSTIAPASGGGANKQDRMYKIRPQSAFHAPMYALVLPGVSSNKSKKPDSNITRIALHVLLLPAKKGNKTDRGVRERPRETSVLCRRPRGETLLGYPWKRPQIGRRYALIAAAKQQFCCAAIRGIRGISSAPGAPLLLWQQKSGSQPAKRRDGRTDKQAERSHGVSLLCLVV